MTGCEDGQDEDPKTEDEVLDRKLEGKGQEVDDEDGRNPNGPVGEEDGNTIAKEPGEGRLFFPGQGKVVSTGLVPGIGDDDGGSGPEGNVNKLIEGDLAEDGLPVETFSEEPCLSAVKKVDLKALDCPEDGVKVEIGEWGRGVDKEFSENPGEESPGEGCGDNGVEEADLGLPLSEAGEKIFEGIYLIVGDQQANAEGLKEEGGQQIGAGSGMAPLDG